MPRLEENLFSSSQADSIQELLHDEDSRFTVREQIGKRLIENEDVICGNSWPQILCTTCMSKFADSEEECVRAAAIVYWGFSRTDILPLVIDHQDNSRELAYRCLISLSFFKKALEHRYQKHNAPKPSFYREVGQSAFRTIEFDGISNHFTRWENFFKEFFLV